MPSASCHRHLVAPIDGPPSAQACKAPRKTNPAPHKHPRIRNKSGAVLHPLYPPFPFLSDHPVGTYPVLVTVRANAPCQSREPLRGLDGASGRLEAYLWAAEVEIEYLRGQRVNRRVIPGTYHGPGPRVPTVQGRTSSVELVLKLRSIAPATLPQARYLPAGSKHIVAERSTFLIGATIVATATPPTSSN